MSKNTLTFKRKKGTDKVHGHTNIFYKGALIGYYLPNNSGDAAQVNENWNFVSNKEGIPHGHARTEKLLKEWIKEMIT